MEKDVKPSRYNSPTNGNFINTSHDISTPTHHEKSIKRHEKRRND